LINECGAVRRMRNGRENRSTLIGPVPSQLCQPQILYDLTHDLISAPFTSLIKIRH
jgi:hypothetical protein